MQDFYSTNIIPEILKTFKINNIVISGLNDVNLIDSIIKHDAIFTQINTKDTNSIKGNPLEILPTLDNYDAIFINDDSNWFTVFNELNIIKKTNEEFPIVFICNNNFPNKRRDSYSNPDSIPSNFRQKYTKDLPIYYNDKKIIISDGFFHACVENTPKNGVLTAIEDFLNENSHIGVMKLNFIKEISMLYLKTQINQKRTFIIQNLNQKNKIEEINFSDKLIENQLLISYIDEYNLHDNNFTELNVEISRKNAIIDDYESKIKAKNNEILFKDSKLSGIQSNLSLKDSQIKDIESKLVNRDRKINDLKFQLSSVNNELHSLNQEVDANIEINNNLESQLFVANNNLNSLNKEISNKNIKINDLTNDFKQKESEYNNKIYSLDQELNQKEENFINVEKKYVDLIKIKDNEINFIKNDSTQKESEYNNKIYSLNQELNQKEKNLINNEKKYEELIKIRNDEINSLKSDLTQKEDNFNNQININKDIIKQKDAHIKQKDAQIKIQQQELDERKQKLDSLEHSYMKQLSKIDNRTYCISCYKEEISNNHLEIKYLKNHSLTKKILSPLSYLYLILKSNSNEISINIKLYNALKNSDCFDIGFYLNNNPDLIESKWCKYFSPELHYVCNGFNEDRVFNKKYFNRNSKKDLLEYLLTCGG